jgi:WD40 repeat protein
MTYDTRHDDSINDLAYSPDGRLMATASQDGTVRLWKTENGELLSVLEGHANHVMAVDFSPDGTRLASASRDGTARIWDLGERA